MPDAALQIKTGFVTRGLSLCLGVVPSLVFAGLVLTGHLAFGPALVAWLLCSLASLGLIIFILFLQREHIVLARLAHTLRSEPRPPMAMSALEDRALIERLPDPLVKLDHEGKVVWRNECAITEFDNEMAALLRHPDLRAALHDASTNAQPLRRNVVLAAPVSRDLEITMIPLNGQFYMLVNDRTRERALEKMRADFVANSSHELRTPLASLIGFIETLQGPAADDPQAQKQFLGIMAEQAARMQRLLGDLLSLSKIEISEHSPPATRLQPVMLLERIVAAMQPVFAAQNVTLMCELPPDLPEIQADADQLTQVFTNLLDNAIKYGKPQGCVKLSASAAPDSRFPPGGVSISVTDDGQGIARLHIPRLTERFYRVDQGRSRAVGGTGLGLAIAKHVVNRHRGQLAIESEVGQGACFTVWLPGPRR